MKDECEMNANMHTKYIESTGYFVLYARAPCLTLCASTETHTRPTILKMWTSEGISETQLTLLAYQKPRYLAINRNKPKWPIHCSLVRIQWGCSPFNHRSSLWPSSEPKFHNSQTIALWLYKFHCFFFFGVFSCLAMVSEFSICRASKNINLYNQGFGGISMHVEIFLISLRYRLSSSNAIKVVIVIIEGFQAYMQTLVSLTRMCNGKITCNRSELRHESKKKIKR